MARISDDDIRRVREATDLVSLVNERVVLTQKGRLFWGCCPFHDEKTPSFKIDPDLQNWHCFGCGKSGDVFGYLMESEHLEFPEAVRALADRANIEITEVGGSGVPRSLKDRMMQACAEAEEFYHMELMRSRDAGPSQARAYLHDRGFGSECARGWHLGYAPGHGKLVAHLQSRGFTRDEIVGANLAYVNKGGRLVDRFFERVMFPVHDLQGRSIAFGGRIIANEDEAKYINSSDSQLYKKGEHLYGLQQARRAIATGKPAMLTEGYMDVVTLHQFGYSSAVGVLGTAFTPEQVKRISGFTSHVELLFDGDGPGRKAALRACEMLLTRGLSCKVVLFPEGEDIDSLLRTQGTDIFEDLRRNAPEGMAFCVRCLRDMAPREAVDWAREFLRQVELPELVSRFASTLSTGLGLAESELRERIIESRGARALPRNAGGQETQPPVRTNPRDREIMTFAVRYPSSLPRLRELGAHLVLSAAWARDLWQKLEEYPVDEVVQHLDPREKRFWIRCRTGDVPPLDNEEGEFGAIRTMLDTLHLTAQSASVSAALRQGAGAGNFEADLEYLRALQETLERTHGEQH